MRKIQLFFLGVGVLLIVFTACTTFKVNKESVMVVQKVYMEKVGMAKRSSIVVAPNKLVIETNGKNSQYVFPDEQWRLLTEELGKLNLSEFTQWESPTTARFYDGAAAVVIMITTADSTYSSLPFDEGRPPLKLEALYNKIDSYYKK